MEDNKLFRDFYCIDMRSKTFHIIIYLFYRKKLIMLTLKLVFLCFIKKISYFKILKVEFIVLLNTISQ